MLAVAERYAEEHNITFSTDEIPARSKTKCLFMCGDMARRDYPAPLQLNGRDLPFVTSATHLGHEITQACSMLQDCKEKRAGYIDRTVSIRETFSFAEPQQILQAVEKYCGDHYGAMLWQFDSDMAGKYFRCWSTCVKLAWETPRATRSYLVDNLLAVNHVSTRRQVLSRYVKFFRGLMSSRSKEVALVASVVSHDVRSTTGKNLYLIREETGLNPFTARPAQVRDRLKIAAVPEQDTWRLGLLESYLSERRKLTSNLEDTDEITGLIDSLCTN